MTSVLHTASTESRFTVMSTRLARVNQDLNPGLADFKCQPQFNTKSYSNFFIPGRQPWAPAGGFSSDFEGMKAAGPLARERVGLFNPISIAGNFYSSKDKN